MEKEGTAVVYRSNCDFYNFDNGWRYCMNAYCCMADEVKEFEAWRV